MATLTNVVTSAAAQRDRLLETLTLTLAARTRITDEEQPQEALSEETFDDEGFENRSSHDQERDVNGTGCNVTTTTTSTAVSGGDIVQEPVDDSTRANGSTLSYLVAKLKSMMGCQPSTDGDDKIAEAHSYGRFKYPEVEKFPPQSKAKLAAFINSSSDLAIIPAFKQLQMEVILDRLAELKSLEGELRLLDKKDWDEYKRCEAEQRLTKLEYHTELARTKLLKKIKTILNEYYQFLFQSAKLRSLGPVPVRDHRNLFHWIVNSMSLVGGYEDFILDANDFVSLNGWTKNGQSTKYFEEGIQTLANLSRTSKFLELLMTKTDRKKTSDSRVRHYSSRLTARVGTTLQISVLVGSLLVPIILLFLVAMSRPQMMMIVVVFLPVFPIIMCFLTDSSDQDISIATLGYAAVLVTFLANVAAGTQAS